MTTPGGDTPTRLSRGLLVALTVRGPVIPPIAGEEALTLTSAQLLLLPALVAPTRSLPEVVEEVAARSSADPQELHDLVDALRARRRLVVGPPRELPVPAAAPSGAGSAPLPQDPDHKLVVVSPLVVQPVVEGWAIHHRDAATEVLAPEALTVLAAFTRARTVAEGHVHIERSPAGCRPTSGEVDALLGRLLASGTLESFDPAHPAHDVHDAEERLRRIELDRVRTLVRSIEQSSTERQAKAVREHDDRQRVSVFPVQYPVHVPNLALGMVFAHARSYEDGRLNELYDLDPYWLVRPSNVGRLLQEHGPSIFLMSNYVWSSGHTMGLSQRIKELSPDSLCIHGGPQTPHYPGDTEAWFAAHPHVDVAVFGEGEATAVELLAALDGKLPGRGGDLSVLRDVPGLAFRHGDTIVRTADRERLVDIDALPSPYLTGVFTDYEASSATLVVLETARGCPYGCTFCDWGSATASRMRKFSLERVFGELEWVARHRMPRIFVADSNFGIFARDVEIAEKVAELRRSHGFPLEFHTSYAKNTVKHLDQIIRILAESGVTSKGALALQTIDQTTLDTVRRSNIKLAKYQQLAATFRREGLPLFTELMVGLPGATPASFRGDLQMVADEEITARIYRTELLVNSPMNEPSYRKEHQIRTTGGTLVELAGMVGTGRDSLLASTASYTEADMDEMMRLRHVFGIVENHGILRHVARFVRHETGRSEVELYQAVDRLSAADPDRWPLLSWLLDTLDHCSVPPLSWDAFYAEVGRMLTEELGVPAGSALATVLTVQAALLPDRDRTFPEHLAIEHDYAAWFAAVLAAKEAGLDWTEVVPPLASFGPATMELTDPDDVCGLRLGAALDLYLDVAWEVRSPVARAAPAHQLTAPRSKVLTPVPDGHRHGDDHDEHDESGLVRVELRRGTA